MAEILIFGHQNPDTDAICAAIAFDHLQKALGNDTEAVAFSKPSEETQYALDHFQMKAPRVVQTVANEVEEVMLVDHNEFQQSAPDIREVKILSVVDHHRIANFETADPLYYRAEPIGCTSTIIYKLYQEHQIEISEKIAGVMLSAIISDTLLFKSPTCTPEDVAIAKKLAAIAKVDLNEYGLALLKAGTNLNNKSPEVLVDLDAKTFPMGGFTVRIAQVNTVDVPEVLERKAELQDAMTASCEKNGYDLFLLVITNILDSDSTLLVVGEPKEKVEEAFQITLDNDIAELRGVVSRKKQVVPPLTTAFEK